MRSTLLSVAAVSAAANLLSSHYASSFSPQSSFTSPFFVAQPSQLTSKINKCQQPPIISRRHSRIYSNNDGNNEFINSLLNEAAAGDTDPYSRYTHQIAIPLKDASELHSALHAIQTSLVRDCPRLIRACVMPALLRLPLLYVDSRSLENGVGGGNGNVDVDAILEEVVHRSIRKVIYGEDAGEESPPSDIPEPILLPFQGLELQGKGNDVLYVVGNNVNDETENKKNQSFDDDEDGVYIVDDWSATTANEINGPSESGWETLEKLVYNIQNELESKYGLSTCWPLDEPQGEEISYDDPMVAAVNRKQRKWRPRVPFVRLPKDFYKDLDDDKEKRNNGNDTGDDNEENEPPSFIDLGFDGISPLFWYEAWGREDILEPPGVRMRSVAVYRRMVPGGGEAESSFYVPTSSSDGLQSWKSEANAATGIIDDDQKSRNKMELPVGDGKLRARERREEAKAMDRLGDVEQRAEREWEAGKARWMDEINSQSIGKSDDDDSFAPFDVGMEVGDVTVEGDAAYSSPWSERDVDDSLKQQTEESLPPDKQPTAAEDMKTDSKLPPPPLDIKPRRELPNIEDNPVFQRLWKGRSQVTSQGQNTALTLDGTPPTSESPLPPYPSDAHFVGAWRVVSSPLGTTEGDILDDAETNSSDNFILRVDGQVMGGPVLDAEFQHKAAGGEWKMFQATRKSLNRSESGEGSSTATPVTQTRLQLRLLVPPEKDRALVMEGEVTRLVMPGAGDASSSSSEGWKMASGGMLDGMLETLDLQSQQGTKGEGLMCCAGEAWMEDIDGGANRRKLGPFSLMKLKTIDRSKLIYTVDVTRPTSTSEDEDSDGEE